ncbi:MAG: ATP-dependent Clp protease ATP-binding subunit ClpC [Acidimicrobiaceae bacterium]|nr:ATP-dependent Clp protease ATP-binding subunit ClpC [Acidimicrobiaceae bacterium]
MPAAEYERFSDVAHGAVVTAEREARLAGQEVVGTEHLLAALVDQDADVRDRLAAAGVTPHALHARIEAWSHRRPSVDRAVFSPALRRTVSLAARLATQDRSPLVQGRHLLNALLEVEDEFVLRILIGLGVDPGSLRRRNAPKPRRLEVRIEETTRAAVALGRRRVLYGLMFARRR